MASLITCTPGSTSEAAFRSEIVVFGDSITQEGQYEQGWGVILQKHYRRRADVLNRGYGGYNSRQALQLVRHVFPPGRRFLVSTVFWGANDSVAASNALQHVPVEEFQANLQAIYAAALAVSRVVVAITPPPVDSQRWPDRSVEQAGRYAQAVRDAVSAVKAVSAVTIGLFPSRLLVLDAHALMLAYKTPPPVPAPSEPPHDEAPPPSSPPPSWHALLSDGLHLSAAGNALLASALAALLDAEAPEVAPPALTLDFPVWREVGNSTGSGGAAPISALSDHALAAFHAQPRELPK